MSEQWLAIITSNGTLYRQNDSVVVLQVLWKLLDSAPLPFSLSRQTALRVYYVHYLDLQGGKF